MKLVLTFLAFMANPLAASNGCGPLVLEEEIGDLAQLFSEVDRFHSLGTCGKDALSIAQKLTQQGVPIERIELVYIRNAKGGDMRPKNLAAGIARKWDFHFVALVDGQFILSGETTRIYEKAEYLSERFGVRSSGPTTVHFTKMPAKQALHGIHGRFDHHRDFAWLDAIYFNRPFTGVNTTGMPSARPITEL